MSPTLPSASFALCAILVFSVPVGGAPIEEGLLSVSPASAGGFAMNCGQLDSQVQFQSILTAEQVRFMPQAVELSLPLRLETSAERAVIRLTVPDAKSDATWTGIEMRSGRVHDLRDRDPARWTTDIPTYGAVICRDIVPGVDWVFRAGDPLKCEWIVKPGTSVETVRWRCEGALDLSVTSERLVIRTELGELRELRPICFQVGEGRSKESVAGGFVEHEDGTVGFWVGDYDLSRPLVLDPDLEWSTYLGGKKGEIVYAGAVESSGEAFVAGATQSTDFPTTPGVFQAMPASLQDCFVAKLSADGQSLIWATFLGGSSYDIINAMVLDGDLPVVVGGTNSPDFPVTAGAFDPTYNGDSGLVPGDAFVTKLSATGSSLVYSTYLGGGSGEDATTVDVDPLGNVVIGGLTRSTSFPVTPGAYDSTHNGFDDIFVTLLNGNGSGLTFSTFLGGSSSDTCGGIAFGPAGDLFLTGLTLSSDFPVTPGAFDTVSGQSYVSRIDPSTSTLIYSTFLAPSGSGRAIAVDTMGRAVVAGDTGSGFPVTPGAYDTTYNGNWDGYVIQLSAAGDAALFGSYLGGTDDDFVRAVALDEERIVVAGETRSSDFPTTIGAYDRIKDGSGTNDDVFVAELGAGAATLLYSTYLGGSEDDNGRALGFRSSRREATVIGFTDSPDYPTTPGAYDRTHESGTGLDAYDGFVTRLRLGPVIAFEGTPIKDAKTYYTIAGAHSDWTGFRAQVVLSCSGSVPGTRLPGGWILPSVADGCTTIGLRFGALLQATINGLGQGATPAVPFPSVPTGLNVTSAAFIWDLGTGKVHAITPPIQFVTL